jgi:DNA-directed RNA polymerase subunit beta
VTPVFDGAHENEIEAELARAWLVTRAWEDTTEDAWKWLTEQGYDPESIEDDAEARRLYMDQWLRGKKYSASCWPQRAIRSPGGVAEWLRARDLRPETVMVFDDNTMAVADRAQPDLTPWDICLRLWMEDRGHKG